LFQPLSALHGASPRGEQWLAAALELEDGSPRHQVGPHIDALAVLQAGAVQFRILHPAGRRLRDKDTLQTLVTENPTYQTAEGIGPGVALSRAEYVLGKVLLQYNEENESREDLSFAKQAQGRVSFTSGADGQALAGVYSASDTGPAFSTGRYHPHAQIRWVWVTP
jgi:hypothetical protein